jgi:hypothetical protein
MALTPLACAPAERVDPAELEGAVRAEVSAFLDDYLSAYATLDTGAIRGLYVSDGRFAWLEDGAVRYRSVEDILQGLAALPPGMRIETTFEESRATVLSTDLATVQSGFESSFSGPGGGFSLRGVSSMVLGREAGGWRIVSGHSSTVRPDRRGG